MQAPDEWRINENVRSRMMTERQANVKRLREKTGGPHPHGPCEVAELVRVRRCGEESPHLQKSHDFCYRRTYCGRGWPIQSETVAGRSSSSVCHQENQLPSFCDERRWAERLAFERLELDCQFQGVMAVLVRSMNVLVPLFIRCQTEGSLL